MLVGKWKAVICSVLNDIVGQWKACSTNYIGIRHDDWSEFFTTSVNMNIMCLEWCTHGELSGSWYLWHRAVMYFASHSIALIELCGPLPYIQASGAFGSLWSHALYLELFVLMLWWLIILLKYLKSSDCQIYTYTDLCSTNYNTWYESNQKVFIRRGRKNLIPYLS